MTDARHRAPATQRNRDPILELLTSVLPAQGLVLEIASGSGEHAMHFAGALPNLTFQPSDPDEKSRASIAAWLQHSRLTNVKAPLSLDAAQTPWPIKAADAVLCINMVHISPWAATEGLFRGAAGILTEGAPLYLYGPYIRAGIETAASNLEFDVNLRRRNPDWGLRDLGAITELARCSGFVRSTVTEMPANNISVLFRRL